MALLRLLCLPSTSHSPHHRQFFNLPILPQPNPFLPLYTSPLPPCLVLKPQNPGLLLFRFSSSVRAQATVAQEVEGPRITGEEEEEYGGDDVASRTRLLAQNVPWTCTVDDLRPLFEKYGTVVDIELSMHNKTRNRGLAFVSMSSHEEALAVLSNLESYEFEGRTLKLTWAKPKKKKPSASPVQKRPVPIHNLFVANLPFQARAKDLKEFFNTENGNVVSAEVIFNENPRGSAGYGFVSFNTKQEAEAALAAFQGKVFMGRAIRVGPSRRFLRQGTKLNGQTGNSSSETKQIT